jgi:hypothetical protein
VYAGSRFKLNDVPGRSCLIRQPSSRNGENPPCGMIGGAMETAASFEVRNAPSSYPTTALWGDVAHPATRANCEQMVPRSRERAPLAKWSVQHY